ISSSCFSLFCTRSLCHLERNVIDDERCLQHAAFHALHKDLDRLALEGGDIKGFLLISGGRVQVRIGRQRRKHCPRRIEYLDGQRVERRRRAGFGGIDVQPEGQGCRGGVGGNGDGLRNGVSVRASVAIEPGVPATAVRRLARGVVDHVGGGGP